MIKEEIKEYLSNKEVKEYTPKKYNGAMVEGMPEFEKLIEKKVFGKRFWEEPWSNSSSQRFYSR